MASDKPSNRLIAVVIVRSTATVALLVVTYFLVPLDSRDESGTAALFFLGLAVLVGMIAWQLRAIVRARFPALRAVEAFTSAVPLYLLLFASTYVVVEGAAPGSFSQPLTKIDSLYFTMTVFATVGFGDITPQSQAMRVLVTVQMLGNLLVLGLLVRSILEAVRRGQSRKEAEP
ncbi:potassium channel family protein [Actinomycetospora flava]|uniref:Potassium channel family protein n=1 Tax=Actinomycetospora flava TaxID=3129232 RepID=A0ABU8M5Y2_9PSEU